ncbi:FAD binding domain-containing protein [Salinigranum salinum]|uniref:FAD binding domain-containing protein n=1 Tax=Salinigranum salinum TaxID=1364937 RepID=UPI0018650CF6|nr:xanthine dehydrogenase family protein subunit M [Salinigranum salinum]
MATEQSTERRFHRPSDIAEATALLREHDAVLVSGGQSLMPLIRQGMIDRDHLVDISNVDGYDEVEIDDGGLHLGGLVTHRELIEADLLETPYRALPETAKEIGDRQVRNWGTIGGSVAHADPSLDYPPTMTVLDAEVTYTGDGETTDRVPIDEFYFGPYVSVLQPHEIVVAVDVPDPGPNAGVAFEKFAWRRGDMSLVNVAARLTVDHAADTVEEARLCVGAMGPTPLRLTELEDELVGSDPHDADHQRAVADRIPEFTEPVPEEHASVDYKNRIASNLATKTLRTAAERAEEGA